MTVFGSKAMCRRSLVIASLALWTAPTAAVAQERATNQSGHQKVNKERGTVYTFYGLRKLERDPKVSDEEKLREWRAFIERSKKQIAYAERALDRWKNASRREVLDKARASDRDGELPPREKIERWVAVERLYPKTAEARMAQRRQTHWRKEETKRLVRDAESVEKARRPKVERIQAWDAVLRWTKRGAEAKAAQRRIRDLQKQLYSEAVSVDRIARVDLRTKLAAWRDVLNGRPTPAQRTAAKRRVRALEAKLGAN